MAGKIFMYGLDYRTGRAEFGNISSERLLSKLDASTKKRINSKLEERKSFINKQEMNLKPFKYFNTISPVAPKNKECIFGDDCVILAFSSGFDTTQIEEALYKKVKSSKVPNKLYILKVKEGISIAVSVDKSNLDKVKENYLKDRVGYKNIKFEILEFPICPNFIEGKTPVKSNSKTENKDEINVTKEEFLAFEKVRKSGVTNMFAKDTVCKLANISKETYYKIVKGNNYSILADKYLKNNKDKEESKDVKSSKLYEDKEVTLTLATEKDLKRFYDDWSFTFEGMAGDNKNLKDIKKFLNDKFKVKFSGNYYLVKGKLMNSHYGLKGDNKYPNDLDILVLMQGEFGNINSLPMAKMSVGARWFTDIVDNNKRFNK